MKRTTVLVLAGTLALALAAGAAWAATFQCQPNPGREGCLGTPRADTITGTAGEDFVRAREGADVVKARDGIDTVAGGRGADVVRGNAGDDVRLTGAKFRGLEDASDDLVFGDRGSDELFGGFAQGGEDRLNGGPGDDSLYSAQRENPFQDLPGEVTREFLTCGPGVDLAIFDAGLDVLLDPGACESTISIPAA